MRKIIFALACVFVLVSSCAYAADFTRVGIVAPAGLSEEEFNVLAGGAWKWQVLGAKHSQAEFVQFYDDLTTMLMAINAGDIEEIETPQTVGEYITRVNPNYEISCVLRSPRASFVFGFLKGEGENLQAKFNEALSAMRQDGTLEALNNKFFANPGKDEPEKIELEKFDGADTIRVAVTGDMPPIDYVAADGHAAGFNTAVLAEIGKRLKINIAPVFIQSASKTAALTSGRVDVVFWYMQVDEVEQQADLSENVITSAPYYDWDIFVHVRKR